MSQWYTRFRNAQNLTSEGLSSLYAQAMLFNMRVTQARGCRYNLVHKLSVAGAASFAPASIDVIFVDGLHTYEGVRDDLAAFAPKLKPNALIILNDWVDGGSFPGVKRAGSEFAAARGAPIQFFLGGNAAFRNLPLLPAPAESSAGPLAVAGDKAVPSFANAPLGDDGADCGAPACVGACAAVLDVILTERAQSNWNA